jgi:enoyl-CoA hydratase/carnithine racemase
MASEAVLYEVDAHGVCTITLNRPAAGNAWNAELGAGYYAALDRAGADTAVRVVVLTGAGKLFCAGADMGGLSAQSTGKADPFGDAARPAAPRKEYLINHASTVPRRAPLP